MFQFTRPGGRDLDVTVRTDTIERFNSRARVGATRHTTRETNVIRMFQFTRPGGRDESIVCHSALIRVSIHAPGWARRGKEDYKH